MQVSILCVFVMFLLFLCLIFTPPHRSRLSDSSSFCFSVTFRTIKSMLDMFLSRCAEVSVVGRFLASRRSEHDLEDDCVLMSWLVVTVGYLDAFSSLACWWPLAPPTYRGKGMVGGSGSFN